MKDPLIALVPKDQTNHNVLTIINDHLPDNMFLPVPSTDPILIQELVMAMQNHTSPAPLVP